jgi:hypothetical protein
MYEILPILWQILRGHGKQANLRSPHESPLRPLSSRKDQKETDELITILENAKADIVAAKK